MAQKYRKLDPRVWSDEKFAKLHPEEKLIAIYCLTAQVNRCGIFVFSPARAAEDLGYVPQTFTKRFERVVSALRWRFDSERRVLYFPRWWRYNTPENPNVFKGNLNDIAELPQTPLLDEFYDNTGDLDETYQNILRGTFAKRYRNVEPQYQEQEQYQEQDIFGGTPETASKQKTRFEPPTVEAVAEFISSNGYSIDPQHFVDYYTARSWKLSRGVPMTDWQAAVRTWVKNEKSRTPSLNGHAPRQTRADAKMEEVRRRLGNG